MPHPGIYVVNSTFPGDLGGRFLQVVTIVYITGMKLP